MWTISMKMQENMSASHINPMFLVKKANFI